MVELWYQSQKHVTFINVSSGKQLFRFGLDAAFVYKHVTFINIYLFFVDELFEKFSSWELLHRLK